VAGEPLGGSGRSHAAAFEDQDGRVAPPCVATRSARGAVQPFRNGTFARRASPHADRLAIDYGWNDVDVSGVTELCVRTSDGQYKRVPFQFLAGLQPPAQNEAENTDPGHAPTDTP
jgi:hypothetical protein